MLFKRNTQKPIDEFMHDIDYHQKEIDALKPRIDELHEICFGPNADISVNPPPDELYELRRLRRDVDSHMTNIAWIAQKYRRQIK